jgi:hypothetical protein
MKGEGVEGYDLEKLSRRKEPDPFRAFHVC